MRRIKYYISFITVLVILVSCKKDKDSFVKVESLSKNGDEFFFGEKVPVWVAVKQNQEEDKTYVSPVTYKWECDGGKLLGLPGLAENLWEAPREAGKYTITITVTKDGKTDIRKTEMFVSSYFFDRFSSSTTAWKNNDTKVSQNKTLGRMELEVSKADKFTGNFRYEFNDPELKAPFSASADIGWFDKYPTTKLNNNKSENNTWWRFQLNRPPQDKIFIEDIRFEFWPVGTRIGSNPASNANFRYTVRNLNTGAATTFNFPINNPAFTFANGQSKKMVFTLTTDHLVIVYIDGVEVYRTDALKLWREANGSKDPVYVFSWRYEYPQLAKMFIDNAVFTNDGKDLGK
nr:hypothetical protein [uncultured Pedobacter sp.]